MDIAKKNTDLGITLPLLPNGNGSLVSSPPWYFGGDGYEVIYETDIVSLREYIPEPLEVDESNPIVSVTITDMTSLSVYEDVYANPYQTQYKECLVKLYCRFKDKIGWYVPISWVDKDFSLMRGFLMGFGKKIGKICISKYHHMNPLTRAKKENCTIRAICESFGSHRIDMKLKLNRKVVENKFHNMTMYVLRHFPNIEKTDQLSIQEIHELNVVEYEKNNIWECDAEIEFVGDTKGTLEGLKPKKLIYSRIHSEGFKLLGTKAVYKY